jgi:hypothetical protein
VQADAERTIAAGVARLINLRLLSIEGLGMWRQLATAGAPPGLQELVVRGWWPRDSVRVGGLIPPSVRVLRLNVPLDQSKPSHGMLVACDIVAGGYRHALFLKLEGLGGEGQERTAVLAGIRRVLQHNLACAEVEA